MSNNSLKAFPLLATPRAPTKSEQETLKTHFPGLTNFEVLGEKDTVEKPYNCLGWAINEVQVFEDPDYWRSEILDEILQSNFFRELREEESEESTLDVFYQGSEAIHVSKLYKGEWTSKLGKGLLIKHNRNALDSGLYGTRRKYYQKFGSQPDPHGPHTGTVSSSHSLVAGEPLHVSNAMAQPNPIPVMDEDLAIIRNHADAVSRLTTHAARPTTHHPTPPAPHEGPSTTSHPPPTRGPPQRGHPAPGHPVPGHPAPGHPAPGHPAPGHPTPGHPPPQGISKEAFEKAYTAWKATWDQGALEFSSRAQDLTKSPQWAAVVKFGPSVIPLVVAELSHPGNDYTVTLFSALDPSHKPKLAPLAQQRAEILKEFAHRTQRIQRKLTVFTDHQNTVLAAHGPAFDITTHSFFQELVKEGRAAVPHILLEFGKAPKGMWAEMLRQIYAIETSPGSEADHEAEFTKWLAIYAGTVTQGNPSPVQAGTVNDTAPLDGQVDGTASSEDQATSTT